MDDQPTRKAFDCLAMTHRIQQRIHAETRGMGPGALLTWFHRRVATSRFAALFPLDPPSRPAPLPVDLCLSSAPPKA